MEFVKIPSGSYMRGCDPNWEKCGLGNTPQRRISISTFWMGKYEVTQEQWVAVMGSNPSRYEGTNHPVDTVSWDDAQEFVRRLNAKEGHNRYRLPTEAEWEYAARAGSTTVYSFGDDAGELGNYAWYGGNSGYKSHPVGQLRPNAWGLHDMQGNVREWVNDWYNSRIDYYRSSPDTDPQGPPEGTFLTRMQRGGHKDSDPEDCTSAYRMFDWQNIRAYNYGFRLALSPGR